MRSSSSARYDVRVMNTSTRPDQPETRQIAPDLPTSLSTIRKAVEDSARDRVDTEPVRQALRYVYKHVDKGPMLCKAWFDAQDIPNPAHRFEAVRQVENLIRISAGM